MIGIDSNEYYEQEILDQIQEYQTQKVITQKEAGLALMSKIFLFENFGILNKETAEKLGQKVIKKFKLYLGELEQAIWEYELKKDGGDEYYKAEITRQTNDFKESKILSKKEAGVVLWIKIDLLTQFQIISEAMEAYKLSKNVEKIFELDFDEMFSILG